MRHTALSVLFTYFCVFVIQPAFGLVGVVTAMLPGRALAAESEAIYNQMVQKYSV